MRLDWAAMLQQSIPINAANKSLVLGKVGPAACLTSSMVSGLRALKFW